MRRTIFIAACIAVAAHLLPVAAVAEDQFPSRPIRMIVAAAPGGNLDLTARVVADALSSELHQSVIVDNRTGASGAVAAQLVAHAAPDGYTILAMANTFTIVPSVLREAGYDPVHDFVGIGMMNEVPLVLVVGASSPYKSVQDLIAAARAQPGKLPYASGGVGSSTHLPAAMLLLKTGVDMIHVPYKGGNAPAIPDVIAGRDTFIFDPITTAAGQVRAGTMRALAVSSAHRLAALPDVPTIAETLVPGFDVSLWTGLVAPAKVPADILNRLHAAYLKVIDRADVKAKIATGGAEIVRTEDPAQFTRYIAEETARYREVVVAAHIAPE